MNIIGVIEFMNTKCFATHYLFWDVKIINSAVVEEMLNMHS